MFNIFNKKRKISGEIGYYGLEEWWLTVFNNTERDHIEEVFQPMGGDSNSKPLTEGDLSYSSQSSAGLLHCLAGWFNKTGDREIAKKIIAKAYELALEGNNILDLHFTLLQKMEIYYRERDADPKALHIAIKACEDQIKIAPQAAKQFRKEYPKKQGKFNDVVQLCQQAKKQGWSGNWDSRISEARKKMSI